MNRRTFLLHGFEVALGLTALPMFARGQASPRIVGFLRNTTGAGYEVLVAAFRAGLAESGLIEGRDVVIEFRWGNNRPELLPMLATDLVRMRAAVIVTNAGAASAVRAATKDIPIVFISGEDPIRMGLVKSLARPEGNLTGVAFQDTELAGKRLELLHELVAPPVPLAVLNDPKAVGGMRDFSMTDQANRVLGRQLIVARASNDAEIEAAFVTFAGAAAGGLYIGSGAFLNSRRDLIAARAARYRLPAVAPLRSFAESGVLASYGPDRRDAYRRAGVYVSRILKGAKPSDLPIELSRKYELVLNLKTAKSLGFGIPQAVLLRADDVIE